MRNINNFFRYKQLVWNLIIAPLPPLKQKSLGGQKLLAHFLDHGVLILSLCIVWNQSDFHFRVPEFAIIK